MEKDDKGSTLIQIGVSGWKFLLVPAYPGCPGSKAVKRSLLYLHLKYNIEKINNEGKNRNDEEKLCNLIHWNKHRLVDMVVICSYIQPHTLWFKKFRPPAMFSDEFSKYWSVSSIFGMYNLYIILYAMSHLQHSVSCDWTLRHYRSHRHYYFLMPTSTKPLARKLG